MDKLVGIIDWCKRNIAIVICFFVAIGSMVAIVYPTGSRSAALVTAMNSRSGQASEISGLMNTTMTIPAAEPGKEPVEVKQVVTKESVADLQTKYGEIIQEANKVIVWVMEQNKGGPNQYAEGIDSTHPWFGDGYNGYPRRYEVFPIYVNRSEKGFAKEEYKFRMQGFRNQLTVREIDAVRTSPRTEQQQAVHLDGILGLVDPGQAPTKEEIDELKSFFMERAKLESGAQGLSPREMIAANSTLARRVTKAIKLRATESHVYSDMVRLDVPPVDEDAPRGTPQIRQSAGPFRDIAPWFDAPQAPSLWDLWDGQEQLWIYQDILTAVAVANDIWDKDGKLNKSSNLTLGPVKRLLSLEIQDRYLGLPQRQVEAGGSGGPGSPLGGGRNNAQVEEVKEQTDQAYTEAHEKGPTIDLAKAQTITGRLSNPLYDVAIVRLRVLLDANQMPKFFNAVNQVNFMTVLEWTERDVDEYQHFNEDYYYYGEGVEVVEVDMAIETLWFRQWRQGANSREMEEAESNIVDGTKILQRGRMPDAVRWKLGMPIVHYRVDKDKEDTSTYMNTNVRQEATTFASPGGRSSGGGGPGAFGQP